MKARNYIFTKFNLNIEFKEPMTFLIYQNEICPDSGKEHLQGYVEFNCAIRINRVKEIFGDNTIHLEKRKGTQAEAIAYCSKLESRKSGPFEFGTKSVQGKRTDLSCLSTLSSKSIIDFAIENQEIACKYSRGIQFIKTCYNQKIGLKIRKIDVTVLIGKPGSGKTRYVYDNFDINDIYKLNTNSNGTLWFDGYENQPILLIDDFKGWIRYTELLTILDIYPYRCQIKGGYTYALWDKVFITSNYEITQWYDPEYDQNALIRRINTVRRI